MGDTQAAFWSSSCCSLIEAQRLKCLRIVPSTLRLRGKSRQEKRGTAVVEARPLSLPSSKDAMLDKRKVVPAKVEIRAALSLTVLSLTYDTARHSSWQTGQECSKVVKR